MYQLQLTPDEVSALEFVGDRYSWAKPLEDALDVETNMVNMQEHEMWAWDMACEQDEEGGHSAFPLAAPAFAEKLREFRARIV